MSPQATATSLQSLIETATAPILAYNDKNWDKLRTTVAPTFTYDEVPTQRKVQGAADAIAVWQGWAQAFPDSKATIHRTLASDNSVVLEVTWMGTHQGPLQTPKGPIAATGKRIEVRACIVCEIADELVAVERQYFDMATLLQQLGVAD
jgi:steroid delta-isomerase-like uncharacterized protein